jgi:transcription elongation GreA/GreB family factor
MDMASGGAGWPIDVRVMKDLLARIERMAGDPRNDDDADYLRRLDTLRGLCGALSVTFDPEVAAIGRRITIQGEDERTESFWLALPGEDHATANTVSIAAPAGRSVAGARVGDVVYLDTEGRRRWAVVLRVA